MRSANRKDCVFRKLEENPEKTPPSLASVLGAFTEDEPETPGDAAEMFAAIEAPVCNVEGCKLSTQGLIRYVASYGDDAPRQELDEMVAPGCAILKYPTFC